MPPPSAPRLLLALLTLCGGCDRGAPSPAELHTTAHQVSPECLECHPRNTTAGKGQGKLSSIADRHLERGQTCWSCHPEVPEGQQLTPDNISDVSTAERCGTCHPEILSSDHGRRR